MPKHQRILLLVSTGVFMSTMDSSMVNVALPTLMQVYASSLALTEWVVLMYLLTITTSLLFWGYISAKVGQGKLYSHGLLVFSLGSLLCAMAPSILLLIFFRCLQAVGASMMMAMGPALIKRSFPAGQLGRGLGMVGIATSLGLMTGPAISGLLLRWSHWRWIFLITVPVGALVYVLGRRELTALGAPAGKLYGGEQASFDRAGGLLYASAVTLTVLLLSHATRACCAPEHFNWPLYGLVAIPLAWGVFLFYERRTAHPLFPVDLFRQSFFTMAMVSAMLSFTVLFLVLLLMPFYLSAVRGFSPDRIGYVMMSIPLCVFFIAPLAGRMHDVIGARIVATFGLGCCLCSLFFLTLITDGSSAIYIVVVLSFLGLGQGMFLAPNSAAALTGVSHEQSGVTSSLLATSRNMGMLLGTALAGFVFALGYAHWTGGMDIKDFEPGQTVAFMQALQQTFRVGTLIAAAACIASLLRGKKER